MQLILNRTINISLWELYVESFPPEERRSKEQHEKIIHNDKFMPFHIYDDKGELVGLLNCWDCGDFIHGEHFAVFPEARNGGIGKKTIELIKEIAGSKKIIIEVEPADNDIAKRRIEFYKREGFMMNDYEYIHPSYSNFKPYKLIVMSYPKTISQKEFETFRDFAFSVM